MLIKIALIGPSLFCQQIEKLVASQKDIQIDSYHYKEPHESPAIIQTLPPYDAILFSGSLPYLFAKEVIQQLTIPVLYFKQDESAIAITILRLLVEESINLGRISIDVREKSSIDAVLHELGQQDSGPFIHILQDQEAIQKVTHFHKNLFSAGKTDYVITSVHAVYEQLCKKNIPAMKMITPKNSILQEIDRAKQQVLLQKSDAAQIAIGIIEGQNVESIVQQMATLMQANATEQQGRYTLFTTRGKVEFAVNNGYFDPFFNTSPADFILAFGYGETIVDATENAQTALNFIENSTEHAFYIVNANKKLQGPFPQFNHAIEMKVNEPTLVEMADKTKLSPANLSKLLAFSQSRQTKQFTANDLALYLNVTRRTAERTLKKLLQFDYARIVGEEMTYRQGRPRALYEFNFPVYY